MWIRRIVRILAVLFSAFVLTSAVMFWLPFLEPLTGRWHTISATPHYEYIDTFSPYADALKKQSPAEERSLLDEIEMN